MIELIIPIKVTGEYSLNKIYSGIHWAKRKHDAENIHCLVYHSLTSQGIKKHPFDCPVDIELYYNSKLDCSNHAYLTKMIEDALKGYVIKDDTKKYVKSIKQSFWDGEGVKVIVKAA